jgi:hypothetical protein
VGTGEFGLFPPVETRLAFAPESLPVGSRSQAVAIADVTGDGRNDVLLATSFNFEPANDHKLVLLAQQPDGSLANPIRLTTAAGDQDPMGLGTGDLNGDGRDDVAVPTGAGVQLYYRLDPGDPMPTPLPDTAGARQAIVADVAGDSAPDLVVSGSGGLSLLVNAHGEFRRVALSTQPFSEVAVADLAGDGRRDVVGAFSNGPFQKRLAVYVMDRDGSVAERIYGLPKSGPFTGIAVGDLTGDGREDVAFSAGEGDQEGHGVFPQGPDGLSPPVAYPLPSVMESADVDADGCVDLVTATQQVQVRLQQADGTLALPQIFRTGGTTGPHAAAGVAVGDINDDGRPDVVVTDGSFGLLVLRQLPPLVPPPPPPCHQPPGRGATGLGAAPPTGPAIVSRPAARGPSAGSTSAPPPQIRSDARLLVLRPAGGPSVVVSLSGPAKIRFAVRRKGRLVSTFARRLPRGRSVVRLPSRPRLARGVYRVTAASTKGRIRRTTVRIGQPPVRRP